MAKAKRPKVDPLAHACERCGAYKGKPCRDYRGQDKPFCQERGRPHITERKRAKKAAAINAKTEAGYGPLFRHLMTDEEKVTPADLEAKRLQGIRNSAGNDYLLVHQMNEGIEHLHLWAMFRGAAELIGAEAEAKLREYALRVYGWQKELYVRSFYAQCLTTAERMELRHEFRGDASKDRLLMLDNCHDRWKVNIVKIRGGGMHCTDAWPPAGYAPP